MNYRDPYSIIRANLSKTKPVDRTILEKYNLTQTDDYPIHESNLGWHTGLPENANDRRIFYRMNTTDINTHNSIIDFDEYCLDYLSPYIKPDDVVVDAGAYVGSFGFWVKILHPQADVVLVEPLAENCKMIRMFFQENGLDYTLYESALHTKRVVSIQQLCDGYHHYVSQVYDCPSANSIYKICKGVQIIDIIKKHGDIKILKIDIEGSEWVVFRQLAETDKLKDIQFVVGEYHGSKEDLISVFRNTHDLFRIVREKSGSEFDNCFVSMEQESSDFNFCAIRL